ncbi:MAG: excinuclease ABC subunit B [Candidatus Cloacimonadota bacterium]|nr:MAG: excinuclease ABC subunit B [Candidatus Cloacimonadota bacterium]
MNKFKLFSKYKPEGDQIQAIRELTEGVLRGEKFQTLLGVTGSGKTFTVANTIEKVNKPTLVISHNKTLAAQLYGEFKQLFPENAVEFFISYYDYYQPEAYIPGKDVYIEKDSDINDEIEKLRLHATMSLTERRDVIIVASVSCIYGLGIPEEYRQAQIPIKVGETIERNELLKKLINIHYSRNDVAFQRGAFRVTGDVVDIYPAYMEHSIRVEFFGDEIERISRINPIDNHILEEVDEYAVYPANHFITSKEMLEKAVLSIQKELNECVANFLDAGKFVEAQRLEQRTKFDAEMLKELGYCSGIENYSRHLTGAQKGEPPFCLIDYFPKDYLLVIDESHVTLPQFHAMYSGDYSRKKSLVEYGFRLPSAFDNRPLKFNEFEDHINQVIFVSATPGNYELEKTEGVFVEQVIRPTGLLDPEIIIKPVASQVDDLLEECRLTYEKGEKILVTALTKRMSEDLSKYMTDAGIKARYLHSELSAIERSGVIRDFRLGEFDVLIGVNLLREGLDMPEVSLVAILDADKTGFLRSSRSLIQTAGRAARNANGRVIFYADKITDSIRETIEETNRRRKKQTEYNKIHNITPETIFKTTEQIMSSTRVAEGYAPYNAKNTKSKSESGKDNFEEYLHLDNPEKVIALLEKEMNKAAEKLEFEKAAELRDRISEMQSLLDL